MRGGYLTPTAGDSLVGDDGLEILITCSFMESLFMSLKEELHSVKNELSQDLKTIRSDVMELGDRVAAWEDRETPRDEEIEQLQEVLCLKEQHIDLQGHTDDLENKSRHKNIRILWGPQKAENGEIQSLKMECDLLVIDPATEEDTGRSGGRRRTGKWELPPSPGDLHLDPDTMAQEQRAVLESLRRDSDS
ncbi:hypothetical protein NDU88_001749 [Pleurodeles waltl]|uniref:Uncharacterized protein n=1 Tax=Pleurodeles waltl TaxID=8319 RepID=A0AAV7VB45_PLEWA|nr:hypothetical protein NDU88_001749 [Pleurodeles waltl]